MKIEKLKLLVAAAAGLSCMVGTTALAADYPDKPISVIIGFSAGGNTDVGARILLPYVEKELGVPLTVINKPGGGGWVGWTSLVNAKPDGYTIGFINTPNLITGYMDPAFKRNKTLADFDLIANHVTDFGVISMNKDEKRYSDIKSLMEYAKTHELTASTTGANGDDHIAMLKVNKKYGTKFVPVHMTGTAQQRAALQGANVDVSFSNCGDTNIAYKNGDLKILAIMSPKRSPIIPDVPTLAESGYPDVYSWSSRGIAAPAGLKPEILKKLTDAFVVGLKNEEHLAKMAKMGLQVDLQIGEDYKKMLAAEEDGVTDLKDILGW